MCNINIYGNRRHWHWTSTCAFLYFVIVISLSIPSSYSQYSYSDDCLSIQDKPGTCVPLGSCPLFSNWLKVRPVVKENLRLIVRFTCFFDTRNPKVCCPNENLYRDQIEVGVRLGDARVSSQNPDNRLVFPTASKRAPLYFPSSTKNTIKNENSSEPKSATIKNHVPLAFPTEKPVREKSFPNDKRNPSFHSVDLRKHPKFHLIPRLSECSNAVKLDSLIEGTYGAFPWIALIGVKRRRSLDFDHVCAGVVINEYYILTVAHCYGRIEPRYVRLGEYDLDTLIDEGSEYLPQSSRKDYRIKEIMKHPDFDPNTFANDLALIRVDKPIALNTTFIKAVCLPFSKEYGLEDSLNVQSVNELEGKAAWTAGWSHHSWSIKNTNGIYSRGSNSNVLQESRAEFTHHEDCRSDYPQLSALNARTQICVGGKGRRNSCIPDSGGPLMYPIKVPSQHAGFVEPKFFMLGLLSYGPTGDVCQNTGNEGASLPTSVYTRISKYLGWILDNMKE